MFLLIIVLLIVAPALTYYVSTTLFYQNAKSTTLGKRPPTIPYLVPGAFHAFSLAYDGPQKYFGRLLYAPRYNHYFVTANICQQGLWQLRTVRRQGGFAAIHCSSRP
jgi:hypothetical protein